jgi:hypothetical protein
MFQATENGLDSSWDSDRLVLAVILSEMWQHLKTFCFAQCKKANFNDTGG